MPAKDGDTYTLLLSSSGKLFKVECAVSPQALAKGLSGRDKLANGTGMLFIFNDLAKQSMWMPDMKMPLDVVWLDETLSVVNITYGLVPCSPNLPSECCKSYSSVYLCKYAIEMNAGDAAIYGFMNGTQMRVASL
jgi:uncharacterized membrane protein (UPF0127 family)